MRLFELAKELAVPSKELLDKLRARGVEAKNIFCTLEALDEARFRAEYGMAAQRAEVAAAAKAVATATAAAAAAAEEARVAAEVKAAEEAKAAAEARAAEAAEAAAKAKALEEAKAAASIAPTPPAPAPEPAPEPAAPASAAGQAADAAAVAPPVAPAATAKSRASKVSAKGAKAVPPAPAAPPPAEKKAPPPPPPPPPKPEPAPIAAPTVAGKVITVRGPIIVKDLADLLGLRPNQLIVELMLTNVMASINERLEMRIAQRIAEKHGFTIEHEKKALDHKPPPPKVEIEPVEAPVEKPEDLEPRPPVVTILGHVDHGKTSLLDRIRNAEVAQGELGGITQHIGAYTVEINGKRITFLDTPGHEAFTAMRARGANLTDIAVIVIAADDGIMPQTVEAIQHAQAAKVPIMVAINKTDLATAQIDRVKQQLAGMQLAPEDWGGTVIACAVSAATGKGIPELLELILLQADMQELKANPNARARGYVIESRLEPGQGPTATLLISNGTLHLGDAVLCGPHWGRVRALLTDHGENVKSAGPATPVVCLGLSGVPQAGAEFRVAVSDRSAREAAAQEEARLKSEQLTQPKRVSLDNLFDKLKENDEKLEARAILKADMQGSLEAIEHGLADIKSDKVSLNTILAGVGNITTNDVLLAKASEAIILGFHVAKEPGVGALAKREGVDIRLHGIIYELLDQVRDAMSGLLAPEIRQRVTGHAEIKQLFEVSKGGKVAGCVIRDGKLNSRSRVRVLRESDAIYEGSIASLRRFQNDVSEVVQGQECGIRLDNFADFETGDVVEAYEVDKIPQKL